MALTLQELHRAVIIQLILFNFTNHQIIGDQAGTLRAEGPFVIGNDIDDAAIAVQAEGDAATQVSDRDIAGIVVHALFAADLHGSGAHIKVVGLADTADILETGQANQLHKFINGDGVIDISLDASFIGDIIGDSAAQVGCVVIDRPLPEGFDKGGW